MATIREVYVTQDDSGHWYVLPIELEKEFIEDLENEDFVDSGGFGHKYGQYMTGGDLNNIKLYAKV